MAWETLVPLGTFLAVALAVWGGLSATADRRARVNDRLDRILQTPTRRAGPTSLMRQQDRTDFAMKQRRQEFELLRA